MPANNDYFNAQIRHELELRGYSNQVVASMVDLLEANDREVTKKLRAFVNKYPKLTNFRDKRFLAMLKDIFSLRSTAYKQLREQLTPELIAYAKDEISIQQFMMQDSIPIEISFASVSASSIRAAVTSNPFLGQLLGEWYKTLEANDRVALLRAIQMGYSQGESIDQIVARVAGTTAKGFRDGSLGLSRRRANDIVRTAINHVSNASRELFWDANSQYIRGLAWVSVLDGRTTAICRARDGKISLMPGKKLLPGELLLRPSNARPPAHFQCRSIMVAVLDGLGLLGTRPSVRDTRLPEGRRLDFAAEAKNRGISVLRVKQEWVAENIGRVPSKVTYSDWIQQQPKSFQNRVLGKTKADLLNEGGLTIDQFVDYTGRELNLTELRSLYPKAFAKI